MKTITLSPEAFRAIGRLEEVRSKSSFKDNFLFLSKLPLHLLHELVKRNLRHSLKGKWSRRITRERRWVYEVKDQTVCILSCRFHYD